jgi:hypothetical protein
MGEIMENDREFEEIVASLGLPSADQMVADQWKSGMVAFLESADLNLDSLVQAGLDALDSEEPVAGPLFVLAQYVAICQHHLAAASAAAVRAGLLSQEDVETVMLTGLVVVERAFQQAREQED